MNILECVAMTGCGHVDLNSPPMTIGATKLVKGMRILLACQNDFTENGIYHLMDGKLCRTTDFAVGTNVQNACFYVEHECCLIVALVDDDKEVVGNHPVRFVPFGCS